MHTFFFSFRYSMIFGGRAWLSITAYQIQLAGELREFMGQIMTIDITLNVVGYGVRLHHVHMCKSGLDQTYRMTCGNVVQVCIIIG